jgi:hypothetical protein
MADFVENTNNEEIYLKNSLLNKYYKELDKDLTLNIKNIQEKNLRCSATRAKWLMYLTKEKENRKRIKKAKDDLKSKLLDKREHEENVSILKQKNEDNLLKDNVQLTKLNEVIEQLDEVIIFLEYSWNILNDLGYNIKNIIDLIKLEQV